jgi:hypothetical protein
MTAQEDLCCGIGVKWIDITRLEHETYNTLSCKGGFLPSFYTFFLLATFDVAGQSKGRGG